MHASSDLVLAIDVGTESLRTGLFDASGNVVTMGAAGYKTRFPHSGWAEQNPFDWWHALCDCVSQNLQNGIDPARVKGIAVDATASTVLPVNKLGQPLDSAILWMDARATEQVRLIRETRHPILKYVGGEDAVEWMVPKALWLKQNRPEVYRQAYGIVECLDWINYRLTGNWVTSICNATCKWNYVSVENGWSTEFLNAIGLDDILEKWSTCVEPLGKPIGTLTRATAQALGLPSGIPVSQGGIDAHVGMLGMGVVKAGDLSLTIGSSSVHLGLSAQPVWDPGIWGPYPDAVIPNLWVVEGGQVSVGSITKWFRDELGAPEVQRANELGVNPYQVLAESAAHVPPGAAGVLALDYWQGNRTPYRDPFARGAFVGLSLNHTRAHLYRAILEAVAYGTRNILETFAAAGCEFKRIIVGGGGTKNPLWLQIHADVCKQPLTVSAFQETSLLGSAICAAVGAGWYADLGAAAAAMTRTGAVIDPNAANFSRYDFYFGKYKMAFQRLQDLMVDLTRAQTEGV